MINESMRAIIRGQINKDYEELINEFKRAIGKTVEVKDPITPRQADVIRLWLIAFTMLSDHPVPWRLFQDRCKGVIFGLPESTEDAWWKPDGKMFLATRDAGYNPEHMLKNLIHEMGHALEEKLVLTDIMREGLTIYGKEPFVDNYCIADPVEDFAETFMHCILEPQFVKQIAINKYNDMMVKIKKEETSL